VTRTPVSRSRSRSPGRFTHGRSCASSSCSSGRGNVLSVRNCRYLAICSAAPGASAPTGRGGAGAYRGGHPPTACFSCLDISFSPTEGQWQLSLYLPSCEALLSQNQCWHIPKLEKSAVQVATWPSLPKRGVVFLLCLLLSPMQAWHCEYVYVWDWVDGVLGIRNWSEFRAVKLATVLQPVSVITHQAKLGSVSPESDSSAHNYSLCFNDIHLGNI